MKYGNHPKSLGQFSVACNEMMLYQYMPIKLPASTYPVVEARLSCFEKILGVICCDFIGVFGLNAFSDSYIYLTAKHSYQKPGCPLNRPGYHSDGFMTKDVNYIWSDCDPTIFNSTEFNLTMDDSVSLKEMEEQALPENEFTYPNGTLLRLDQFNIHKCAEVISVSLRTFLKVSFSPDKYDLMGNTHNYLIDYEWDMRRRFEQRNIPQKI
jgi:hypothetical protein